VVGQVYREKVMALAADMSGKKRGSAEYLASYAPALDQVFQDLTVHQRRDLEVERQKWQDQEYPEEVQIKFVNSNLSSDYFFMTLLTRNAAKKGARYLKAFAEKAYREMGMHICVLEYHTGVDHQKWFKL